MINKNFRKQYGDGLDILSRKLVETSQRKKALDGTHRDSAVEAHQGRYGNVR